MHGAEDIYSNRSAWLFFSLSPISQGRLHLYKYFVLVAYFFWIYPDDSIVSSGVEAKNLAFGQALICLPYFLMSV